MSASDHQAASVALQLWQSHQRLSTAKAVRPTFRFGLSRGVVPLLLPAALVLTWHVASTHGWLAVQILPPPDMVFGSFGGLLRDGTILENLEISLVRIGIGFGVGVSAGLCFGILLGLSDFAERYIGPIFRAVAQVPSLGWLPILILLLGIGEPLKYVIIAKACFVPMAFSTAQGVRSIPVAHREVARVFRLRRRTLLFRLLLPAIVPSIFTGLRLAIGQAWVSLVVVEMLAATEGVGYMMTWGRTLFQTDVVLVGMILIGVIGVLVDVAMRRLETAARRGQFGAGASSRAAPANGWRGAVVPGLVLASWIAAADLHVVGSPFFVTLGQVLRTPFVDPLGRALWPDLVFTLARAAAGFAAGASLGFACGLAMGISRTAERVVAPTFYALRQIAVFAWIPLLTAWFGAGDGAKVVFVTLSAFFPMLVATHDALRGVPERLNEVATVLHLSPRRRVVSLVLPATLPAIFLGLELALMQSWIGAVGAEYAMGLGQGVGSLIAGGREQFRMDIVAAGVLVLALNGYVLNALLRRSADYWLPWRHRFEDAR